MKKPSKADTPFFARFLESQRTQQASNTATTKYPSDSDEDITLIYPPADAHD